MTTTRRGRGKVGKARTITRASRLQSSTFICKP